MERLTADYLEGQILLIDKPLKWSSFQVNKLKYALIKLGFLKNLKLDWDLRSTSYRFTFNLYWKFTRISELQGQAKEYTGTFFL
jgi:tRNA pseudouridine55 synthase